MGKCSSPNLISKYLHAARPGRTAKVYSAMIFRWALQVSGIIQQITSALCRRYLQRGKPPNGSSRGP